MSHLGHRTYAIHETALCHTINTQKTTRAEFSRRKCMAKYSICSLRLTNLFTFAFLLSFCFFCGCGRLNFINRTRLRHELSPEITERVLLSLLETVTVRNAKSPHCTIGLSVNYILETSLIVGILLCVDCILETKLNVKSVIFNSISVKSRQ